MTYQPAYDDLPPELQDAVDEGREQIAKITGEDPDS